MYFVRFKLILLLFAFPITPASSAIQCVDHNNSPVDWYVLYKLPKIKHNSNKLVNDGVAYTYITSENVTTWKLSSVSINSTDSMIGLTLKPLYKPKCGDYHILYNDQPPNVRPKSKKGHTKGFVLGNEIEGIWVVHSVPTFPPADEYYRYPSAGAIYGQSFLCMSLNIDNLNRVGMQLMYNQPQIYSENMPVVLRGVIPNLYNAAQGFTVQSSPWYNALNLETKNGTTFLSFAKTRDFGKELYADLVSPYLDTSLFAETWLNGKGRIPSICRKLFSVKNVESINMTVANLNFESSLDHSKWSVSNSSHNWICIGDINRELHQEVRGGGTVCLDNAKLSSAYRDCVMQVEQC